MGKILKQTELNKIERRAKSEKLVLVGGCFDILHAGHIAFLNEAKKAGDILVVMLESDETVKKLKGANRPINNQTDRAIILSNISSVDFVIPIQSFKNDENYRLFVKSIEPDIIAVTVGNKVYDWEREYVKATGGRIIEVIERQESFSTTKIAQNIKL